jgi:hypothetical protein
VSSYALLNSTFMLASTIHLWATRRGISLPVTNSLSSKVVLSTLHRSIGVIQGCLPVFFFARIRGFAEKLGGWARP